MDNPRFKRSFFLFLIPNSIRRSNSFKQPAFIHSQLKPIILFDLRLRLFKHGLIYCYSLLYVYFVFIYDLYFLIFPP